MKVDKAAIEVNPVVISHLERLETEAEIQNRKAEEEKKAEAFKAAGNDFFKGTFAILQLI